MSPAMPQPPPRTQTIAIIGNPNTGKSTVFNCLTGSHQHIGNWPGVTVEKKEGWLRTGNCRVGVIDLPGLYSLTAFSLEERIARQFLMEERPDVVIDVLDASHLERNLYLALQLKELGVPLILDLNMMDAAEAEGYRIDAEKMSALLGLPVVKTIGSKGTGIPTLHELVMSTVDGTGANDARNLSKPLRYGERLDRFIDKVAAAIQPGTVGLNGHPAKWCAIKLLENDDVLTQSVTDDGLRATVDQVRQDLVRQLGADGESLLPQRRYGIINGLLAETLTREAPTRIDYTRRIDKVATHPVLGLPVFLLVMFVAFWIVAKIGNEFLLDLVDVAFGWFGATVSGWLAAVGAAGWLSSLIVDGVVAGIASVVVFVPLIFTLFFVIALLEDSGYMARVAFVMDRVMHKIGLHGKAFVPMVLGFGCNVSAIMGTRILENRNDRLLTMLINPFMSCSARLPIYALFAAAFFPANAGLVIFGMYALGIVVAIGSGKLFRRFLLKGESAPFIMELPPYRVPTLRGLFIHMWEHGKEFLQRVGGIIFSVSVVVWFLATFPWGVEYASRESFVGMIGGAAAPLFEPLGVGTWQNAVSFIFGFLAKEVVVSTLGILYVGNGGEPNLIVSLQHAFTPLAAMAFIVFTLLYTGCMSTIAVIKRESGSWGWAGFSMAYQFALAWVLAFAVYQGGRLLGLG